MREGREKIARRARWSRLDISTKTRLSSGYEPPSRTALTRITRRGTSQASRLRCSRPGEKSPLSLRPRRQPALKGLCRSNSISDCFSNSRSHPLRNSVCLTSLTHCSTMADSFANCASSAGSVLESLTTANPFCEGTGGGEDGVRIRSMW